jgi:hypothetical protein
MPGPRASEFTGSDRVRVGAQAAFGHGSPLWESALSIYRGSNMIEFKLGEHTISRGNAMIEIWRDGVFVAGIFPGEDRLKIVSHLIADVLYDDGKDAMPPVPAAIVQFAASAK